MHEKAVQEEQDQQQHYFGQLPSHGLQATTHVMFGVTRGPYKLCTGHTGCTGRIL